MKYTIIIITIYLITSCSVSSRLERKHSCAIAEYIPVEKIEQQEKTTQNYIEIKHDSTKLYLAPGLSDENGEQMMNLTLNEVVPWLHSKEGEVPLQKLSIRGNLFNRVQGRNYWQFYQYLKVFRPSIQARQKAFERFVRNPYPEGTRLDSIVESSNKISYFYKQEVATRGEGKKILIILKGEVVALDGSRYVLPPTDTLQYNISSMLSFIDTTTRYVTKVIEKYTVVNDKNYLSFKVNDTNIDTLGNNNEQLNKIECLMEKLINQNEFYVDSIVLTASASPEGTFTRNNQLARQRALSLKRYLGERFGSEVDTLISVRWIAEDWQELGRLIGGDQVITEKKAIQEIINEVKDPDKREIVLRDKFPKAYKYIRKSLYPLLRSVNFKYDLRRVGMIKDTIHTTEPDTLYSRGVQLLSERRYHEALNILEDYKDQNSAIALLSIGFDNQAYNILSTLPETAITDYLKAIVCSRLDKVEEGRNWFIRACSLNENLEYRGRLDPEINKLLIIEEK